MCSTWRLLISSSSNPSIQLHSLPKRPSGPDPLLVDRRGEPLAASAVTVVVVLVMIAFVVFDPHAARPVVRRGDQHPSPAFVLDTPRDAEDALLVADQSGDVLRL